MLYVCACMVNQPCGPTDIAHSTSFVETIHTSTHLHPATHRYLSATRFEARFHQFLSIAAPAGGRRVHHRRKTTHSAHTAGTHHQLDLSHNNFTASRTRFLRKKSTCPEPRAPRAPRAISDLTNVTNSRDLLDVLVASECLARRGGASVLVWRGRVRAVYSFIAPTEQTRCFWLSPRPSRRRGCHFADHPPLPAVGVSIRMGKGMSVK